MVAGFHLIRTAYGWWLPNDPRGSSSHEIRVERIGELGPQHFGRKEIQPPAAELRAFYTQAAPALNHELLQFDLEEREIIGATLADVIAHERYTCYACAIMPDHVHCLIRKHKHHAEEMIEKMQEASRDAMRSTNRRSQIYPVWGGPGWKVYLYTCDDFKRVIRYIEANPREGGLPDQRWGFVKPYDGWIPGNPRTNR